MSSRGLDEEDPTILEPDAPSPTTQRSPSGDPADAPMPERIRSGIPALRTHPAPGEAGTGGSSKQQRRRTPPVLETRVSNAPAACGGHLHSSVISTRGQAVRGTTRTRWSLISRNVAIREAVLASPRLMAQTDIQLFELNQRTLSQWFCRRQKETWRAVLEQGTGLISAPAVSAHPLPPAKGLSCVQVGQGSFNFQVPEEQPGPSGQGLPPPPPGHTVDQPGTSALLCFLLHSPLPRTTAFRKRKAAEAVAAGEPKSKARRQSAQYTCSRCGQLKRLETATPHQRNLERSLRRADTEVKASTPTGRANNISFYR
ncbi:uncharacterized protein LOC113744207 [Larimichthys crocea]|uniref:uncharacterized protein LOC113744207 n=1 Tax=Larimichthys crocea TaxID=215358 RepID=UPI000F5FDD3C|nr:uncharacterized protein LOC113744207 [Larimichthys crocea]